MMISNNDKLFSQFREIHDRYQTTSDPEELQEEFNNIGEQIMILAREWEDKLCNRTESTHAHYSANLAEKFQGELRKHFPMVDHIGITVFKIDKIKL